MLEAEGAVFAVNILGEDQTELSNRFAWVKDEDRFAEGEWTTAADRCAGAGQCAGLAGLHDTCPL